MIVIIKLVYRIYYTNDSATRLKTHIIVMVDCCYEGNNGIDQNENKSKLSFNFISIHCQLKHRVDLLILVIIFVTKVRTKQKGTPNQLFLSWKDMRNWRCIDVRCCQAFKNIRLYILQYFLHILFSPHTLYFNFFRLIFDLYCSHYRNP
jgi:hypothetical protein